MGIERLYGISCDFMRLRHMFLLPPSMRMNSRLDRFILNKVQKPWSVGPWWLDIVTIVISGSFGRINLHQHPCPWYTICICIYILCNIYIPSYVQPGVPCVPSSRWASLPKASLQRSWKDKDDPVPNSGRWPQHCWFLDFKGANFWTLHLRSS